MTRPKYRYGKRLSPQYMGLVVGKSFPQEVLLFPTGRWILQRAERSQEVEYIPESLIVRLCLN